MRLRGCGLCVFALVLSGATACDGDSSQTAADTSTDAATTADTSVAPDVPVGSYPLTSCASEPTPCVEVSAGDNEALFEAVNSLEDGVTVVLGEGTWKLDNQVTLRGAKKVRLIGQGLDKTVLDFVDQAVQSNGVDVVGDDFLIQDLTIANAKKDGLRIEESDGVTIRRVKATWSGGPLKDNGAYGLYPVRCTRVLMENCEAWHASDAGIYVGQSRHVIVRNNLAKKNVAGLEIENTQYADVHDNVVEENTAGLVVFDLPGNPVVGRDVKIYKNTIRNNNTDNFAPGGTVSQIPSGTGTFALASRRVEITDNTYENNRTVDIAIVSGLAIEGTVDKWKIEAAELIGDTTGLVLTPGDDGAVFNFRTTEVHVHGNTHSGSGSDVDWGSIGGRPLGYLMGALYNGTPIDTLMYDAIGESAHHPTDAAGNSNDNHVCFGANEGATFVSLNLELLGEKFDKLELPTLDDVYRPAAPWTPFDCAGFTEGPIIAPTMQ